MPALLLLLTALAASPNIVLITADTLRAGHLGCYGYARNTSPHLDRLAADGLVFDDFICEVPLTNPSFGAMMSSRAPRMTGATRNGLRMPESVPLLAEQLRGAGYHTYCVQSNWTLRAKLCGLDRGFDVYEDHFHTKRWGIIKPERYADEVSRVALKYLAERPPDRPFFAWIHYSDPHAPYRFHRAFNPSGKTISGAGKDAGAPSWRLDKAARVRAKYDSEIAYMDHEIARVLDALPRENTAVLFTADHGESLYEHNYLGHGRRIYQTCLHIPLIIRGPGIAPGRNAAPARGLDIAPTVLALAGLPALPGMMGVNLLSGNLPESRSRVVETYGGAVPRLPGARALMAGRPPQRQGVLLDGWKLILDGDRAELFHLREDPLEERNLASRMPDKAAELSNLVAEWNRRIPKGHASEAAMTEDDWNALKSLGYLD